MRKLTDVTLVCVSSIKIKESWMTLRYCMNQMEFDAVKFITHDNTVANKDGVLVERCRNLTSSEAYSYFLMFDLHKHIDTKYCLLIQHDGFIVDPEMWDDNFYNYDYIGAPWPSIDNHFVDPFGKVRRIGNGGFSFRSKKLLEVSTHEHIPCVATTHGDFYKHHGNGYFAEDLNICVHNAHIYEQYGCVFAPYEIACKFSRECTVDANLQRKTFGVHGPMGVWIPEYAP
jgi:hypothetical protein